MRSKYTIQNCEYYSIDFISQATQQAFSYNFHTNYDNVYLVLLKERKRKADITWLTLKKHRSDQKCFNSMLISTFKGAKLSKSIESMSCALHFNAWGTESWSRSRGWQWMLLQSDELVRLYTVSLKLLLSCWLLWTSFRISQTLAAEQVKYLPTVLFIYAKGRWIKLHH